MMKRSCTRSGARIEEEKSILSFDHHTCRGVGAIGKRSAGRRFRSPPAKALRMLSVLVEPERADEIFEYIYTKADMDKPMGGILVHGPLRWRNRLLDASRSC